MVDLGKTNARVLAFGEGADPLGRVSIESASRPGPPYTHLDTERVWGWLLEQLSDFGEEWPIDTIVVTTHGCAPALIDDDGLVLPVPDYEVEPPPAVGQAYAELVPPYEETFAPLLPAGHNMARHLFWLQREFPEAFARARYVLGYPQYWAWRLGGQPASEVTYLGAHTHLWAPAAGDFSSLVDRLDWRHLFPPIRPAWHELGHLRRKLAQQTGLAADCRVLCGLHDSNAAYLRYLGEQRGDFALISTGTWMIVFAPSQRLDRLDRTRDVLANVDVTGTPVPAARFMGGREYRVLAGGDLGARGRVADVEHLITRSTFALPSFAPGGPFPDLQGRVEGQTPASPFERVALATLYVALMTDVALELLASRGELIVDGGFAGNDLYVEVLAALRPDQRVSTNRAKEGTASGASLLARWPVSGREPGPALSPAQPATIDGLGAYAEEWRARASGQS